MKTTGHTASQDEAESMDAMIAKYGSVEILAPEYKKLTDFVRLVANMTMDGEEINGRAWEMPIDDVFDTVNNLIRTARELLNNKPETKETKTK